MKTYQLFAFIENEWIGIYRSKGSYQRVYNANKKKIREFASKGIQFKIRPLHDSYAI